MKIQEKTILYTPFREGKLAQKLRKIVWSVCPKVNMEFLHEPAILLLDIGPRESKKVYQSYLCSHAVLFKISMSQSLFPFMVR